MSADNRIDDYWTQQSTPPEGSQEDLLCIKTIQDVEPLDAQFGVDTPKTVPDALYEVFFGQPDPTEAERKQAGGNPENVPPLHTYAILDAAKVPGLPELLAASGLEHRCLFKGDAYEELKDVAPWIVKLEAGNNLTRNLFTRSDAGWHLWDDEPGIYLRSHGTLDEMWGHFRKFTRVRDEQGTWFYFRFWEADFGALFFGGNPNIAEEAYAKFGSHVSRIICQSKQGHFTLIRSSNVGLPVSARLPFNVVTHYKKVFEDHRWKQFVNRFTLKLLKKLNDLGYLVSETELHNLCEQAKSEDYHFEDEIETYILDLVARLPRYSSGSTF